MLNHHPFDPDGSGRRIATRWQKMSNKRMAENLSEDEATDVSQCEKTEDGYYILTKEMEEDCGRDGPPCGMDFCDAPKEAWIWSIGKHKKTGQVLASTDAVFYQNPEYECLWLR